MVKYVGAVDQGTTSTRFMIFDQHGSVIAVDQKEHEQIFPKPGWVEHNPLEIWQRTQEVIAGALKKANLSAADLAAVGITNQRETTIVWEKSTGKPIYNAIVWQDTRTDTFCAELAKDGGQGRFREKVGLPLASARRMSVMTKRPSRPSVSTRLRPATGAPTRRSSWSE